jgi:proton-dependent oligopeptide transporter, POT family
MTNTSTTIQHKHGFWHMPKAFYSILFIEFWERFGFYGMQSVAVLFFIQKFHLSDSNASSLFASFASALYALLIIGGYLGDKILGLRRTYLLGIVFLMVGYGSFAFIHTETMMYIAIGTILVGNIFFKTNAGNYVNRCFEPSDKRLDSAFTYFYMSINLGSFFGAIIIPFIAVKTSYPIGISVCGIGMFIALISFFILQKDFSELDNEVGHKKKFKTPLVIIIAILGLALAYGLGILLGNPKLTNEFFIAAIGIFLVIFFIVRAKLHGFERHGMTIVSILLIQAMLFYIIYMQMATALTLFAEHNVHSDILGINIPAGVTQSFNSLFIFLLSPILANLYMHSEKSKNMKPISIPSKFAFGMLACGLAYLLLSGSCFFADSNGKISMIWLFLAYGLYSLGELLISAIGLSMVSKLMPFRFGGFAQASWFLAFAAGLKLGGVLDSLTTEKITAHANNFVILHSYQHLFTLIGITTTILSLIFFCFVKKLGLEINTILEKKAQA